MPELAVAPLPNWGSFYVIVGSAAAVLAGLVFVALSLVADSRTRSSGEVMEQHLAAFTGSTMVHLCAVLLVCALLSAPWSSLAPPGWLLGGCALGGVVYALATARRLRHRLADSYQPLREDWLWYAAAPLCIYAALIAAALVLPHRPTPALFAVGALILVLLFLGLRNAWDVASYTALMRVQRFQELEESRRRSRRGPAGRQQVATPRRSEDPQPSDETRSMR